MKTILKNGNVFYHGKIQKSDIEITDEIITAIGQHLEGEEVIDCQGLLITPGFVDLHVHLREPGFEHKGTIRTETLSAKYGGYSHIVAMANTKPCMDDVQTIEDFVKRVKQDSCIHTYTYSAITEDLKGEKLTDFAANSQFDIVKGFSDDGKGVQNETMMKQAMYAAKKYNSIIVAHCEDEHELQPGACVNLSKFSEDHELVGINNASEYNHAIRDLKLAEQIGNRYHICHISTKETVEALRQYRKKGLPVSGEACPHHLILTDENIKNLNPNYKMNPPLRSREDLNALIAGINDGTITCISTDHAPHSDEEKQQPIDKAPFGIIGNQHAFSLVYTYLVKKGLIKLETVLSCMTVNPSKVIGLDHDLEIGKMANLTIIDLDEEYVITKDSLKSKATNTPFIDTKCFGAIKYHILDGKIEKL
ncbi:dihydroorotase [[Clostridium] spiroforme]|nr:dihydroorotase [Thomasclavelia spiroformis]MBM6879898.1 dihydroorotase [Thomasclavelia spiroformis]MBM6931285.1 dihydroorotase [Thomasclavelia spiroformis]